MAAQGGILLPEQGDFNALGALITGYRRTKLEEAAQEQQRLLNETQMRLMQAQAEQLNQTNLQRAQLFPHELLEARSRAQVGQVAAQNAPIQARLQNQSLETQNRLAAEQLVKARRDNGLIGTALNRWGQLAAIAADGARIQALQAQTEQMRQQIQMQSQEMTESARANVLRAVTDPQAGALYSRVFRQNAETTAKMLGIPVEQLEPLLQQAEQVRESLIEQNRAQNQREGNTEIAAAIREFELAKQSPNPQQAAFAAIRLAMASVGLPKDYVVPQEYQEAVIRHATAALSAANRGDALQHLVEAWQTVGDVAGQAVPPLQMQQEPPRPSLWRRLFGGGDAQAQPAQPAPAPAVTTMPPISMSPTMTPVPPSVQAESPKTITAVAYNPSSNKYMVKLSGEDSWKDWPFEQPPKTGAAWPQTR